MFIAYPDLLKNQVTDVFPGHWRIQAAIVKLGVSSILLINTYFPIDPQSNNADYGDLLETLAIIKRTIDLNKSDHIVWVGDINSDFTRNSYHTVAVDQAIQDLSLQKSWDNFADYSCTHEILGHTSSSLLDHFFSGDRIFQI